VVSQGACRDQDQSGYCSRGEFLPEQADPQEQGDDRHDVDDDRGGGCTASPTNT
jgi:hypothetical protein